MNVINMTIEVDGSTLLGSIVSHMWDFFFLPSCGDLGALIRRQPEVVHEGITIRRPHGTYTFEALYVQHIDASPAVRRAARQMKLDGYKHLDEYLCKKGKAIIVGLAWGKGTLKRHDDGTETTGTFAIGVKYMIAKKTCIGGYTFVIV